MTKTMKATLNLSVFIVSIALFSCDQSFEQYSLDSILGNCLVDDLQRSPVLVRQIVQRPNVAVNMAQSYQHNKRSWIVRYPEVRIKKWCRTNYLVICVLFFFFLNFTARCIQVTNSMYFNQLYFTWKNWWLGNCSIRRCQLSICLYLF